MKDIFADIQPWLKKKAPFAVATVVNTWGSAPRGTGSTMGITADMQVCGSVSGGCIEGAVIQEAQKLLAGGPPKVLSFGVSNEMAWSVGLTCGGKVDVYLEKHPAYSDNPHDNAIWQALNAAISENRPAILLTHLDNPATGHLLVNPDGAVIGDPAGFPDLAIEEALQIYPTRKNQICELDGQRIFVHIYPRKDRLLIIGAAHISIPLVKFAKDIDFEVIVIDPRRIFATAERFAVAPDQLSDQWPDEILPAMELHDDTYVVLLTHDPKIDDVALHYLLRSDVQYIGALGSRRTHAKRCERLAEAGFSKAEIARIHGPAGIDIQAKLPEEIALSIISEVIHARRKRGSPDE